MQCIPHPMPKVHRVSVVQKRAKIIAWILRRTGSCEKAVGLISQSLDMKLPWRKRIALAVHTWICSQCRRYREQLRIVRQIARTSDAEIASLEGPGSSVSLTPEARERIKKALREFERKNSDFEDRDAG